MIDIRTEIDLESMQPFGNNEGKNSTVYLAYDKQLKHQFIVKKIKKTDIFEDFGSDDEDNLFLESSILYKVSHPNVTEIQYASFDNDYIYMVMPYYKKGSVQALLECRNLSMREFVKLSLDFLTGLLFVHSNQLVHFDIKPTNILINNNGKASLTDFGLAKYIDVVTELASPNKMYSVHFPPEIFISGEMGRQADIYQAGITLYRMANGNDIWNEQLSLFSQEKVKKGTFPDRKCYLPHVQNKIRRIINKCLSVDVDKRYESVLDIINDLAEVEGDLDWRYERTPIGEESWYKIQDKMEVFIKLIKEDTNYMLETTKTNIVSKRSTKISAMCQKGLSKAAAYKIIHEYIE